MSFLPHDLHLEILKRLPPLPHVLASASVVCKAWHGVVNDPAFLRELYRARGAAPVTLGFFHNSDDLPHMFVPAGEPTRFDHGCYDRRTDWQFVDSRHGRVLLSDVWDHRFLVWHPMTEERHLVRAKALDMPEAPDGNNQVGAALICDCATEDGEEDQGQRPACHASPFRVAVVFRHPEDDTMLASVFSSLTGQWCRMLELPLVWKVRSEPCTVVGNVLYQQLVECRILAFDTDLRTLTTLHRPRCGNVRLLKMDGGVLGLAGVQGFTLHLWARDADADDWVLLKTVNLKEIIPGLSAAPSPKTDPRFTAMPVVKIIGVTEEGDALFLWTMIGIFMLGTESMELMKVHGTAVDKMKTVYPYASFYLPAAGW
jgi:hypothetical protein